MKKFLPYILALFIPCVAVAGAGSGRVGFSSVHHGFGHFLGQTHAQAGDAGDSARIHLKPKHRVKRRAWRVNNSWI